MKIITRAVGIYDANCYIVIDEDTKCAAIIDPGGNSDIIENEINKLGLDAKFILLTHGHVDHVGAVHDLREKYDIQVFINYKDEELVTKKASVFGVLSKNNKTNNNIVDGDILKIGSLNIRCIETPGHTPGGVCYLINDNLFSGDTLFASSIGRTDLIGGDYKKIIESIRSKLLILPDETKVFPGHGPSSTIGIEKIRNPRFYKILARVGDKMIIKIKINDSRYRYDIFQILSLFYTYNNIEFVEKDYDINIEILENQLSINYKDEDVKKFILGNDIKLKEQIKKELCKFLSIKTNKSLPWGTLVGIRPSKIASTLIDENYSYNDIIKYYKEHYLTAEEKAKLCIEVANNQQGIINKDKNKVGIYIGMPFCPTRCSYCSFASNPIGSMKAFVSPYLEALKKEIIEISHYIDRKKLIIESIYFGGGTPTSIEDNYFEDLMQCIYNNLIIERNILEFTVECGRPDSITSNKLITMKNYNVTRISINPQTMNDSTLRLIGRAHSVLDVVNTYNLARQIGFDNINMDIIIGLSGEGIKEVQRTCDEIFKLAPDSITVHGLSIKRASQIHENTTKGAILNNIDEDEISKMYDATRKLASSLDMIPYYMYRQKNMIGNMENIGYAKSEKFSVYNIQMIEDRQTIIALGADAVSKVVFFDENRIERCGNVKDVKEYTMRIDEMIKRKIDLLDTLY